MIIAGVDGSRAGLEAAVWAAREAAMRHVPLRVVHAIHAWTGAAVVDPRIGAVAEWMRREAGALLAETVTRARHEAPGIEVEAVTLDGDPRRALVDAAGRTDLLVVGNHGLGGFRGLLLGSVAYGVVAHAACDVVVVRELPAVERNELVVGVAGSPGGRAVLAFAFAEASLRNARLRAVHAWSPPVSVSVLTPGADEASEEQSETRLLTEALAGWRERYPEVEVIEEVARGHPVDVLRASCAGADLLVLGSHGDGEFAGLVLGSVSQAMLHHAPCPLVIVRLGG
ncbi:universal stress protein [Microbispora sp. RL4-1S]|uniref:Universal stress protein n=1 Tax=Microbispora oryzae TaxID=2806554 RepID=A0A940WFT1_9ACTN|nr:universal stress protein [Microbispora oryzae]MBP2703928.1 universal stress protein [Microbispora oryzae]